MAQSVTFQAVALAGQTFFSTPFAPSAVTNGGSAADFTPAPGGFNLDTEAEAGDVIVATVSVPDSYVGARADDPGVIASSATTGSLPTADGTIVIADAASPTVVELLAYCVELEAKYEALRSNLRDAYLVA